MTLDDRRRTDPAATHAYTVPVVREVPILPGPGPAASGPQELGPSLAYTADAEAW
jgi:hypothetical protein